MNKYLKITVIILTFLLIISYLLSTSVEYYTSYKIELFNKKVLENANISTDIPVICSLESVDRLNLHATMIQNYDFPEPLIVSYDSSNEYHEIALKVFQNDVSHYYTVEAAKKGDILNFKYNYIIMKNNKFDNPLEISCLINPSEV